jgi:small subunit ribosomal protein S20
MTKLKGGRHSQGIKSARQSLVHYRRNQITKSQLKSAVHKVEAALKSGQKEEAKKLFVIAQGEIDRVARKKIIHQNTAGRIKSRLARKLV